MIHVEASQIISARPEAIYAIFTDYRVSHPAILPKPYFASLVVEEGGQGAGTVFRAQMDVMGTKTDLRMVVSEPQPGRVLREEDETAGIVTTFTVEPVSAEETRVTLATDFRSSPGLKGWIESLLNPLITRRIYRQELQLVADYVRQHP
ncbi:MAG: SRPBCC family protein [Anaerolineaceae bacterium]|nr:SRPBCC family protein [Anaerolineaceae bacterium]